MSGQIGPIPTQYPQGVTKKTPIKLETWSHQTSSATQKKSVQAYSLRPQTVAGQHSEHWKWGERSPMYGNAILWHAMHLHNLPHRNQMNTSRPSMQPISNTMLSPFFNCFFSAFHSSETLNSAITSVIMQQLFFPGIFILLSQSENNGVFRGHSIFPICQQWESQYPCLLIACRQTIIHIIQL